jgi:hypothetical protein
MVEIAGGAVDKICRSIGTNELKLTIHLAELLDLLHLDLYLNGNTWLTCIASGQATGNLSRFRLI